jgi:hypothetical protein
MGVGATGYRLDHRTAEGGLMLRHPVLSLAYVKMPVQVRQAGAAVDPTGYTVQVAFTADGTDPVSGDWKTGSWETDAAPVPDRYWAKCLVGPGGAVALAVGTYVAWVKITASPEIPVLRCGLMEVV